MRLYELTDTVDPVGYQAMLVTLVMITRRAITMMKYGPA
ncbi:hypothetical protein MLPF_0013 [Mycobacterium lepromatosis]|uniref:Uncharacterized protein n=1 Tax=Mycobacterium lepromatosis TaxID=480418 RepID=A0A0F4ESI8_9MYCO|nr:hypothetical protein MLPM_0009 [Mycobacterium lepromatosis]UKN41418.1 hypothetical protein MLPF_0013 [Mycobacterium lepromatosis]